MEKWCKNWSHDYENNTVDAYVCKKCWDKISFEQYDQWKENFTNLDF